MEINEMIIAGLQGIVTGLSQQADGHVIQSKIFAGNCFMTFSYFACKKISGFL